MNIRLARRASSPIVSSEARLRAIENEIITYSLTCAVVMIPVDRDGKPIQELVVRSILRELRNMEMKREWSIPYHR